jgi:hypothetical protein
MAREKQEIFKIGGYFMPATNMKSVNAVEIVQALFDSGVATASEESTALLKMWRGLNPDQKLRMFATLYNESTEHKQEQAACANERKM